MASRWRMWDFDCLEETFIVCPPREKEIEPLIQVGSTKETPYYSLSSIVLPKEAFLSTSDDGSVRSRGRGRALANRALGFDKPNRRPGERKSSDKGSPIVGSLKSVGNPKSTTLGSQYLGSEYLYEELFPSLDQSTSKTDAKSSWGSKPKKERPNHLAVKYAEKTTRNEGSFLEKSKDKSKSNKTGVLDKSRNDQNPTNDADISNDKHKAKISFYKSKDQSRSDQAYFPDISNTDNYKTVVSDTNSGMSDQQSDKVEFGAIETISGKNSLQSDKVEFDSENKTLPPLSSLESINSSERMTTNASKELHKREQSEELNQLPEQLGIEDCQNSMNPKDYFQEEDWIESANDNQLFPQDNDEATICVQLSASPNEETVVSEETIQVEILHSIDTGTTEQEHTTNLTTDKQYSTNGHLSLMVDADTGQTQLAENMTISSSTTNSEVEKHIETNNLKENLDDSLDMSTSDVEMDPCNVLLENLPLALTEEELQEIVEPYGEMVSYNFQEKDDTSKICIVRMPNSLSGELLVVSLDGWEVDGYRIKATMDYS